MRLRHWTAALLIVTALVGCSRPAADKGPVAKGKVAPTEAAKEDKHGWWCAEHGIPEAECSMCSAKVAAELKKKGDWCEKHDRAQSQCFVCDPSLKEKYAAVYRAKFGKEPPPIEEEGGKKDDKKDAPKPEK